MKLYSTKQMMISILGGGRPIPPCEPTIEDLQKLRERSIDLAISQAKPANVVEVVTPQQMPLKAKQLLNAPVADASETVII